MDIDILGDDSHAIQQRQRETERLGVSRERSGSRYLESVFKAI